MSTATVTSKGQITIPAEVRRRLDLSAGARVEFVETVHGSYELVPATGSVRALRGIVSARAPVTLEEMDSAIAAGAAASSQA